MKAKRWFWVMAVSAFVLVAAVAQGDVPQLINYQGQLTDASGTPITGTVSLKFEIFDALTGGNKLPIGSPWEEIHSSVPVTNGVFSVVIGGATPTPVPIPLTIFDGGTNRFLQITVNGTTVLSPRRQFTSVPYAFTTRSSGGGWTDDGTVVRLTTSTDNVGIGTTTPNPSGETSWAPVVTIGSSGSNKAAIVELQGNNTLNSGGVGALVFRNTASSSADKRLGQIQVDPDGVSNSGNMQFETTNAGTLFERMRITKDGNVGIGTTSPNPSAESTWGPVVTVGPSGSNKAAIVELQGNTTGAGGVGAVVFRNTASTSTDKRLGQIQMNPDGASNSGYLRFETTNNGVLTERMRITKEGYVGIATTNPGGKLHIDGDNVTGLVLANTSAAGTALDIRNGKIKVTGAGLGTTTPVFIHRATAANITSNYTVIDHPSCNGNPNAILIITSNWNPGGVLPNVNNNHATGVWYTGTRWAVFNQDLAAMPVNAAFNVLVVTP